ncbi:hypothetical protein CFter6_4342 [Collimonas fungivorans]|uniref:Uncharacterized protein n=1 Tax=Collimonas fungivorans TaxID=158899 RepID=A0A127PGM0_9BURK|nr:hypothetical protein CFter6_4342 [Collimonas fungivorans]
MLKKLILRIDNTAFRKNRIGLFYIHGSQMPCHRFLYPPLGV